MHTSVFINIGMPYDLNIPGWMPEKELKTIERIARGIPENGIVAELGTFLGRSAVAWAASAPTATVHCIDLWPDKSWFEGLKGPPPRGDPTLYNRSIGYDGSFRVITEPYKNIIGHKGNTHDQWDFGELDLVFVDANHKHESVLADLVSWSKKLRPDGLLCGHDFCYYPRLRGVMSAVTTFAHNHKFHLFVPANTHFWMLIKGLPHHKRWWYNQLSK
jgi:predicted O-methyltransferase YrrM